MRELGAGYLAGLDAGGADVQALGSGTDHGANPLNVRVPTTLGAPVRVRDVVAEAGTLAADIAGGSHGTLLVLGRPGKSMPDLIVSHERIADASPPGMGSPR